MPSKRSARPWLEVLESRDVPSGGSGLWQPVVPVLQVVNGQVTMVGKQHLPPVGSTTDDVWLDGRGRLHQIDWTATVAGDTDPAGTMAALQATAAKDDNQLARAEAKLAGIQWPAWLSDATGNPGPTDAQVKEAVGNLARKAVADARRLRGEAAVARIDYLNAKNAGEPVKATRPLLRKAIEQQAKAEEAGKFALQVAKLTRLPATEIRAAVKELVEDRTKEDLKLKTEAERDKAALNDALFMHTGTPQDIYDLTNKLTKSTGAAKQAAADTARLDKILKALP